MRREIDFQAVVLSAAVLCGTLAAAFLLWCGWMLGELVKHGLGV